MQGVSKQHGASDPSPPKGESLLPHTITALLFTR